MEENSQEVSYDDKNFNRLISECKSLTTFSAIASWDKEAQLEIERILKVIPGLDTEISRQRQAIEKYKQSQSEKSFVARLFNSNKEEKESEQLIEKYNQYKIALDTMASQLQESIDFTPNTLEDQKALLKELRQRKKELQVEKRAAAAAMKAIRADARQEGVHAGIVDGFFGGRYYDSKTGAAERRQIRFAKEAKLGPHESIKASIDRQLIQIDRDIIWAEKFKE